MFYASKKWTVIEGSTEKGARIAVFTVNSNYDVDKVKIMRELCCNITACQSSGVLYASTFTLENSECSLSMMSFLNTK